MGSGFEVISVGKKKLVRSVPTELNKDHNEILELAQVTSFLFCFLPSDFVLWYFLIINLFGLCHRNEITYLWIAENDVLKLHCFHVFLGSRLCDCWRSRKTAFLDLRSCYWCSWYFTRCMFLLSLAYLFLCFLITSCLMYGSITWAEVTVCLCRRVLQWLMMAIEMVNADIGSLVYLPTQL